MAKLHGTISDSVSGDVIEAKVHVLDSTGHFAAPGDAILKVGPGQPFFYCAGEFTVDLPVGPADILVERGTEYTPFRKTVNIPKTGIVDIEIRLERWTDLPSMNWYPGNTHIHYDEKESRPDERIRFDPKVHNFSITVVSILQRRDLPYASNKYPIGILTDVSTAHHVVDIGEESRHNDEPWRIGYGHVMFLKIRNIVEPVSRGVLVGDFDPDYPPLCYVCDDTHEQGGIALWCHNGNGMEAPVAAALGKLDGFNLFDPYWMDPEYDIWYHMLNCGITLPASTGSDWFVCSNNRVYVQTKDIFTYDSWVENMKQGRTFITNGPALFITADGESPGGKIKFFGTRNVDIKINWYSHYPLNRFELIHNGKIVQQKDFPEGTQEGKWNIQLKCETDGWVAARCSGIARDSFGHFVYAHTSPIYLEGGTLPLIRPESARFFIDSINNSLGWIKTRGRFTKDSQREEVYELFLKGKEAYEKLL